MKINFIVLLAIWLMVFAGKPVKNLSTSNAFKQSEHLIKDQSFLVFPELRENPIKWFDSIPEEKVQESVVKNNKYNYKPKFTMSKSKFDNLYEAALKGVPFNENDEMHGMSHEEEEAGVMPATDAAADGAEGEMGGEEQHEELPTHEEAIEMLEKILAFLKKDKEVDAEHGDLGDEDQEIAGHAEEDEGMVAEEVDAEDLGHVLTKANGSLKKGNPDSVNKIETSSPKIKNNAGTADKGKLTNSPEPKELSANVSQLQNTKNFKVGAKEKVGDANLFDQ